MKTEVKLGLGVGAALLAVIAAAYLLTSKPGTPGTTPGSTAAVRPEPVAPPVVPATRPAVDTLTTSLTPTTLPSTLTPATQPSGLPGSISGLSVGPATTQPLAGGPSVIPPPTTIPSGGFAGGNQTPLPSGEWGALLAGSSSSGRPGTLPPSVGASGSSAIPGSGLRMPAGTTPGSAATGSASTYTIARGDSMYVIAQKVYGNGNLWPKIVQANVGVNPNRLKIGQVLRIPSKEEVAPAPETAPRQEPASGSALVRDPRSEYQVVSGDSLEKISRKLYGRTTRWEEIYELNKATIGGDARRLKIGMVLKLPAAPTSGIGATTPPPAPSPVPAPAILPTGPVPPATRGL